MVNLVVVISLMLRLYKIDSKPGYEWDEPVYSSISSNYIDYNYPAIKLEGKKGYGPYLYHPPFDSKLKSLVFQYTGFEGVTSARIVSAGASSIALLFTYYFFKKLANKKVSIISILLMASDGWLIYTNRLNLMENMMILLGIISLFLYSYAISQKKNIWYILSGVMLAITVIYKHTGIYYFGVPLLNLIFTKRDPKKHISLYLFGLLTIVTYVLVMYLNWGQIYLDQNMVQIKRAFGIFGARGVQYSFSDAIKAMVNTYWIYISTILTLLIGTLVVVRDLVKHIVGKVKPKQPLLLSWSLATLLFYAGISLRAPQYLIMLLTPLYLYLTVALSAWINSKKNRLRLHVFLGIILLINSFTWYKRFFIRNDNALLATYEYINSLVPEDAVILTEESIGVGIKQTYYKFDLHNSKEEIEKIKPSFVVVYLSSTQKLPKSQALESLINKSSLVKEFEGFKEKIYIYSNDLWITNISSVEK